jgi:flagellar hook-basal body complex protein FliE
VLFSFLLLKKHYIYRSQTKYKLLQMGDFDSRDREEVYSKKVRAGKRTYFFDVKATRSNDYYVTITESKKRLEDGVFVKHKIFLYKEDFEKFAEGLKETTDYIKANQEVAEKRYEFAETGENGTSKVTDDISFEL